MKGYVVTVSAAAVVASSLALAACRRKAPTTATPGGAAPGGPGAQSRGTARKDRFTVAVHRVEGGTR